MLASVLAIVPFLLFTGFVFVWMKFCKRFFSSRAEILLAGFVLALAQVILTSLVFGAFGLYRWELIYTANIVLSFLVFSKNKSQKISFHLKELLKKLSLENKLLLSLLFVLFASRVILAIAVSDVSFDAVNYHMAWVGHAIQEQHLGPFETPVPWINSYPKNLSLFYGWFILPPVNSFFVDIVQVAFVFVGIISSYLLLLRLKFSKQMSLFSGMLFAFFPLVILQSTTNYIDLALAALVLSLFAFAFKKTQTKLSLTIFAFISGVLLGSKATMLIPVFFASCFLLYRLYHQEKIPFGSLIKAVGAIIGIAGILSLYWYGRNLLVYGDLLYPVKVVIAGITLVPGVISADMLIADSQPEILATAGFFKTLFLNFYQEGSVRYDMSPGGFGPLWAWIMVPSMIPSLFFWLKEKSWEKLSFFIVFWIIFLLSPGNWWLRYVFALVFTGILAFAEVATKVQKKKWLFFLLMASVFSLTILTFLQSAKPFFLTKEYFSTKIASPTQADYSYRYGEIYKHIAEVAQKDTIIAYDSSWFVIYPLWNQQRSNTVIHIPVQKNWLEVLISNDVDYLVVKSDSPEYQFIQLQPEPFTLLFEEGIYFLYQLN
jgi:hypothetical protein